MTTRWDQWYSHDNLARDERILTAPPSLSARKAAGVFLRQKKWRILDVACGIGRDTFFLAGQGLCVTGVDASLNGLIAANRIKETRSAAAEFVNADARCLPFEGESFDGIYCFGLLHEFVGPGSEDSVRQVIAEFRRLLREDGALVITAVSGSPQDGLPHVQLFTHEMFEGVMAGWKTLEICGSDDIGCTNRRDYHIWYGLFIK